MVMNIFIFILILIGLSCVFVPFFLKENERINNLHINENDMNDRLVPRRNNDDWRTIQTIRNTHRRYGR